MSGLLKLIYSVDQEWPPRRKRQLYKDVRNAITFSLAEFDRHGAAAALRCVADHFRCMDDNYPPDWHDVAGEAGLLDELRPEWTA